MFRFIVSTQYAFRPKEAFSDGCVFENDKDAERHRDSKPTENGAFNYVVMIPAPSLRTLREQAIVLRKAGMDTDGMSNSDIMQSYLDCNISELKEEVSE